MKTALDYLAGHWLAFGFIGAAAVALLIVFLLRARLGRAFQVFVILCAAAVLPGVGALALAWLQTAVPVSIGWGLWILATAAVILVVMAALLLLTGAWSKWGALAVGAAALFGLGGWAFDPTGAALVSWVVFLAQIRFVQPWFLLILLAAPLTVLIAWRSLFRFDALRPWIAAVLRTAGIALLALSLAQPVAPQSGENVTVLFVVDRSLSVPAQYGTVDGQEVDLRQRRILTFLNDAVAKRNSLGHPRDRAGLIVFGKQPRLELPPSDAPRFNLPPPAVPLARDGTFTDIGAALKMALASFPEDTAKRIVLISDGNENRGNAEEQAKLARSMGVQIDVVPLAKGQRNEQEVMVERVQAPSVAEQGSTVPIRVLVRSYNSHHVGGLLTLSKITEDGKVKVGEKKVGKDVPPLEYGLNPYSFPQPLSKEQRSYTYEAEFVPEWYEDTAGVYHEGKPPLDRPENNIASAHVVASGRRNVLILEGAAGEQADLEKALAKAGESRFVVTRRTADVLNKFANGGELQSYLAGFDCVILANVPEDVVTADQQERLRSNVEDLGCGLIMIGGPDSFGAGGWQDSPVEKALPVDCDIKSLKVEGRGGLVLVMHGYEMQDGNGWEKKIAKLAIQRLGPADEVGVIDGLEKWHIPFQEIGDKRDQLLAQLDKLQSADMRTFDNALHMATAELNKNDNDPEKALATKHVIIISDGDPPVTLGFLATMKASHITITTVGVATHGNIENNNLQAIADACPPKEGEKGHFYNVTNPNQLPSIYIKESRLVSQSFIDQKAFAPQVVLRAEPTKDLPAEPPPLQQLQRYVRTTKKDTPLATVAVLTPPRPDTQFPVVAYWHYGLGKTVAVTNFCGTFKNDDPNKPPVDWAKDWPQPDKYDEFWQQVVGWALRPTESSRLRMVTEYRDGKIHITVDAQTEKGDPDTGLTIRGGVTPPHPEGEEGGAKRRLRFEQTKSGRYEATVEAEDSGSYFVNAQAFSKEDGKEKVVSVPPSAVTLPYSREFSEPETNAPFLEKLRDLTGGVSYDDTDAALKAAAESGTVFRPVTALPGESNEGMQPIWQWLLLLAALLLFLDVAVRRVSVDWQNAREVAWRTWARLRGHPLPPDNPEVLERLQGRRAAAAALDRGRAARRFEATGQYSPAPPGADAVGPSREGGRPAAPRPDSPAPEGPEPGPADALEALRRAKRRARGEDPDKPK